MKEKKIPSAHFTQPLTEISTGRERQTQSESGRVETPHKLLCPL